MAVVSIEINDELLKEANKIFDDAGLDLTIAVRMLLKRVVREQSIVFLFSNSNLTVVNPLELAKDKDGSSSCVHKTVEASSVFSINDYTTVEKGNMSKSIAIRLLRSKGYNIARNVTYASKNRGAYNYWANPEILLLNEDWSLILNDWIGRKIYLFNIPAKSISQFELTLRADKNYLIDLQIMYRDNTFTDNRSGFSFAKFLTAETNY